MKPRTGRYPKHIEMPSEFALSVSGMATARSRRCKGGILVIALDNMRPLTSRAIEHLGKAITRAGIKALIVNTSCKLIPVDAPQTFFMAGHGPPVRIFADHVEMERVRWCETSHGLVCQVGVDGTMTVRKFRSVKCVPVG